MPSHLTLANVSQFHILSRYFISSSSFLLLFTSCQLLGETEEGIRMLATFDVVGYSGAPLPV